LESYGETPVVNVKLSIEKELKTERTILTKVEVNQLYESCENTIFGMRDKVVLAIYYGCGLRSREGRNLELGDIDFSDGLLHVRKGKNYKERYVPMSNGVSKELQNWIANGHPIFSAETNLLIPNTRGKITDGSSLNKRLKLLCITAEIDKHITLHCLRHSIATHLLQSGMELENISRFLGHQGMEATKIYTRIVNDLDEEI
jgi:site-specific recombinase XerD